MSACEGIDKVNSCWKWFRKASAMSSSFVNSWFTSLDILLIWFFFHLYVVNAWKNLVFLSPLIYQFSFALCCHFISPYSIKEFNSLCSIFTSSLIHWYSLSCKNFKRSVFFLMVEEMPLSFPILHFLRSLPQVIRDLFIFAIRFVPWLW